MEKVNLKHVSYEFAEKLKALGHSQEIGGNMYYTSEDTKVPAHGGYISRVCAIEKDRFKFIVMAPSLESANLWLLKYYDVYVEVRYEPTENHRYKWAAVINDIEGDDRFEKENISLLGSRFPDPDAALEKGLGYVLANLTKKDS